MPLNNGYRNGKKDRKLVVVQQSGGNDYLNSIVPYTNGLYYDFRSLTHHDPEDVLKINDTLGFGPTMGPIKELWDEGKVALFPGSGYPSPNRSHFRSMDIWHTANPETLSSDGWLGKTIRELDPQKENVVTGVSFGSGLPRAMYLSGTPAISVTELEGYGLLTDLAGKKQLSLIHI